MLTQYFQRALNTMEEVKIAFFGDHYITDIFASSENRGWDGIAVVEELALYDRALEEGSNSRNINNDEYWGRAAYFVEHQTKESHKRSYFISQLENYSRYMLPFVSNIDQWMGYSQASQKK